MLYIAKDKVHHMSMSENERQALNIKNKVQEFDDGVISSEELVGYMLDHEFIYDTFANDAIEDEDEDDWDEDDLEDEESEEWNNDDDQARNESVKLTFDKFLAAESARDNRIVGVSEDSAIRERARRHQERPINRIKWG